MKFILLLAMFSSCTLFNKGGDDEIEKMTSDVLKRKEGLNIRIEPIEEQRR